jgi:hypothetical protein
MVYGQTKKPNKKGTVAGKTGAKTARGAMVKDAVDAIFKGTMPGFSSSYSLVFSEAVDADDDDKLDKGKRKELGPILESKAWMYAQDVLAQRPDISLKELRNMTNDHVIQTVREWTTKDEDGRFGYEYAALMPVEDVKQMKLDITDDTSKLTEPQKLYTAQTVRILLHADPERAESIIPNVLFAIENDRPDALREILTENGIDYGKFREASDESRATAQDLIDRTNVLRRIAREKRYEEEWKKKYSQEQSQKKMIDMYRRGLIK